MDILKVKFKIYQNIKIFLSLRIEGWPADAASREFS